MLLKKNYIILSTISLIFLTGCTSTSPALYPQLKIAENIKKVEKTNYLKAKDIEKVTFELIYKPKTSKPLIDNYVNTRGGSINIKKSPSIVIALPVEDRQAYNNAETLDKTKAFKTEGYINKSEPNVEKELMRFGFSVLDRSKFEAKLRTVRDSVNNKNWKYDESDLYTEKLKYLKQQFEKGKISDKNYWNQLSSMERETKRRTKGQKEIIDMSELIRAAQSEGVQADYILQLNKIEEYSGFPVNIPIKGQTKVEEYLKNNPYLEYGTQRNNIPFKFTIKAFQVTFSAKLINVQSGKVVWTGMHELNSLNVEKIIVNFNIIKEDISTHLINKEINILNNRVSQIEKSALNNQYKLNKLYKIASKKREYEDEDIQIYKEKELKDTISRLEKLLMNDNKKLDELNMLKHNINNKTNYSYKISDLLIKPDLKVGKNLNRFERKTIEKHRQKLLNMTIRSLLNTIKIK